jgi:hypothetical protein
MVRLQVKDNHMKTTRHVLKAAEVSLDRPLPLSLDPAAIDGCGASQSDPDVASARITQNHPEYTVIEVTCPCGRVIHIRCDRNDGEAI